MNSVETPPKSSYYKRKPDVCIAIQKRYYQKNIDARRAYQREYNRKKREAKALANQQATQQAAQIGEQTANQEVATA